MPKWLGSDEVIRVLREHGFFFVTQRGSHAKYKNEAGRIAIVPAPKKGTAHRYYPFNHSAIGPRSAGLRILKERKSLSPRGLRLPRLRAPICSSSSLCRLAR